MRADLNMGPVRLGEVQVKVRSKKRMPRDGLRNSNKRRFILVTTGHLAQERRIYAFVSIMLDGDVPYRLDKNPRRVFNAFRVGVMERFQS
ncbi:MAG: hypothetical protein V3U95_09235 [Dehalococcoidia bacterium]